MLDELERLAKEAENTEQSRTYETTGLRDDYIQAVHPEKVLQLIHRLRSAEEVVQALAVENAARDAYVRHEARRCTDDDFDELYAQELHHDMLGKSSHTFRRLTRHQKETKP